MGVPETYVTFPSGAVLLRRGPPNEVWAVSVGIGPEDVSEALLLDSVEEDDDGGGDGVVDEVEEEAEVVVWAVDSGVSVAPGAGASSPAPGSDPEAVAPGGAWSEMTTVLPDTGSRRIVAGSA